eukprot:TRINITY_DN28187_c0_g1_i2.p1 TRINITY_DN28187_c0_g1~~TRINITY_DN28187_c0_g1_i2.p1  ORF type:complete len:117 (-),score=16.50 TRINITY_DN28187_c0_g1_i2:75-425(-)
MHSSLRPTATQLARHVAPILNPSGHEGSAAIPRGLRRGSESVPKQTVPCSTGGRLQPSGSAAALCSSTRRTDSSFSCQETYPVTALVDAGCCFAASLPESSRPRDHPSHCWAAHTP